MKLIDKSALVAEIEGLKANALQKKEQCKRRGLEKIMHQIGAYNNVLSFLDTLEVKEVDLDNFIREEFDKYSGVDGYGQLSVSYNGAEFYSMIKRLNKAQKGEKV